MTSRSEPAAAPAKPWNMRRDESAKAYQAFELYRDDGAERTHERVATACSKSVSLIRQWSARYLWADRCQAFDEAASARAADKAMARHADVRARQAATGLAMQEKAMEAIRTHEPVGISAQDAIRMVKVGAELERRALGLDTTDEGEGRLAIIAVLKMNLDDL